MDSRPATADTATATPMGPHGWAGPAFAKSNTANAPAAVTAGTDSKNENRAAASRVRPSASPADMVIPLREVPGTRASACATLMMSGRVT